MAKNAKKDSDIDWSILKTPIIFLCISILLFGSMDAASDYFNAKMEKEYKLNKAQFQSISRRYLDIDQEEQLLLDYYPKFVKLYNEGVIGREKRLNWIEALRESGESAFIPNLRYAIESQAVFTPSYEINYSGFKLYSSRMELTLGLLHEGDIFNLLDELNETAKGMYTVNECKFKRNGRELKFEKGIVNINGTCTLYWITINSPDGTDIEIL